MPVVGAGEADRQCALRRRIQREGQVDLVGLQIEHRIAVGGFDVFQLRVERRSDASRHVDRDTRPLAGGEVLAEERHLAGQRRNAQQAGAANAVEGRLTRRRLRRARPGRGNGHRAKCGPQPASCLHDQSPLWLQRHGLSTASSITYSFSGSYRYRTIPRTLTLRASGPTMSGTPDRIPRVAPPRQPLCETRQGETTTTLAARCRTDEEPTTCTDVSNTQKRLNRWSNSSSRRPPAKSSTARWKSCVPASPPTQC